MKLCRFHAVGQNKSTRQRATADISARVGLLTREEKSVIDLSSGGVQRLDELLEDNTLAKSLVRLSREKLPKHKLTEVQLLAPVDEQEVWAAGVTYLRSKAARMDESEFSASAYDRVYVAKRPELFFKSMAHKVADPDSAVGIRRDAKWNVPEPELALVFNSRGLLAGYTIGNDMSSRDIEGENLLYLPQAKIYNRSCALGPFIVVGGTEAAARRWTISITIEREDKEVFVGDTRASRIKRTFAELQDYLFRSQTFPKGAVLLTGTGVVPPDDFTLRRNDVVAISISGIGTLRNTVALV
ncbi:MAG: fumarylacetoacetate hydrolase family protein [Gemmatimonadaceae bacterium]